MAEIIALASKSLTLAESVILPACKKMVKSMFGEKVEKKLNSILLSNDTISRRILEMSENVEDNVQKKLKNSNFALTMDESTDISNKSQLLAFVRFIDENEIINQFLCCKEMSTTTRGQDIFEKKEKFCENLSCEFWMSKMEYRVEIFSELNITNSNMQGKNENILTSTDKLLALKKKIVIW
ncbi:Hypothetical predicted protein [Octopus vulgaris]|uniref:Uncharacterized protein n=1 Tax=Octopus vulgaris TaxID=6645 RepID=A0AA36HJD0_OCTVU|nr:Hypothetical predicted protein [Octopus vulgaris]